MKNQVIFTESENNVFSLYSFLKESHRFILHLFFIHLITTLMNPKDETFLNRNFIRLIIATILSVLIYNLFFKKKIDKYLEYLKEDSKNKIK